MADRVLIKCCMHCTTKRHVGCHSTCEDYLNEKAMYENFKEDCRKINDRERILSGFKRDDYGVDENGKRSAVDKT